MHTNMRAYIHTYMYSCIHTKVIHTYIHVHTIYIYINKIHTCMHACIHIYMHTYIHAYIHTYMNSCIYTKDIHTYIHTYIHRAYIHTCMHFSLFTTFCPSDIWVCLSNILSLLHVCMYTVVIHTSGSRTSETGGAKF